MKLKENLEIYQKKYYDARHICWAYMLGHQRVDFRSNDNGEPSGTAGKPILGQINSFGLTNILIVVIRYFGGIKLGTSGLIVAYREAAAEAIRANEIIECLVEDDIRVAFEYPFLNDVMRIVKEDNVTIISQYFNLDCDMTLRVRRSAVDYLRSRLAKVESLRFFRRIENLFSYINNEKIKARVEIRIPSFIPGGTYVKFMVFLPLSPFTAMNEIFVFNFSFFPLTVAENPESYGTLKK